MPNELKQLLTSACILLVLAGRSLQSLSCCQTWISGNVECSLKLIHWNS